jgi:flagellar assembly protein FliH
MHWSDAGGVGGEEEIEVRRWQAPAMRSDVRDAIDQVSPLTAGQLAEIETQAREQGYLRGIEEGRCDGRAEMQAAAARLNTLLENLNPISGVLDEPLLAQLGDLVLVITRQFVRRELAREPGEVIRVVREALAALPVSSAQIRLHLHPQDAALVREALPAETLERSLRLIDDLTLSRGGVRLDTDVSHVDATVETRLASIAAQVFGDEREHTGGHPAETISVCADAGALNSDQALP